MSNVPEHILAKARETGDANWMLRERAKMQEPFVMLMGGKLFRCSTSAEYAKLAGELIPRASEKQGLVAYTADEYSGLMDRQKRATPEKFVELWLGREDQALADEFHAAIKAVYGSEQQYTIHHLQETEEIVNVYENGPYFGSCMHGDDFEHIHPTHVYGRPGDLSLLVMTDGSVSLDDILASPSRHVVARCIAWKDKNWRGRIYSERFSDQFAALLATNGWSKQTAYYWEGAKLNRIPYNGTFIAPWMDVGEAVHDNGAYLVIDDCGEYGVRSTDGIAETGVLCPSCDSRFNPDDGYYVANRDEIVCESCIESGEYVFCEYSQEYYEGNGVEVHTDDSGRRAEIWFENTVERYAYLCERSREYYSSDDGMIEVIVDNRGNTETWHSTTTEKENVVYDCETGEAVWLDAVDMIETEDGYTLPENVPDKCLPV